MNEQRNRLLRLLSGTHTETEDYESVAKLEDEYVADHLIANGVIAPPCKIGDTVYMIVRFSETEGYINELVVDALHITSGKDIHGHRKPSYALVRPRDNFCFSKRIPFYLFGKVVFLSKPEAEKALEG